MLENSCPKSKCKWWREDMRHCMGCIRGKYSWDNFSPASEGSCEAKPVSVERTFEPAEKGGSGCCISDDAQVGNKPEQTPPCPKSPNGEPEWKQRKFVYPETGIEDTDIPRPADICGHCGKLRPNCYHLELHKVWNGCAENSGYECKECGKKLKETSLPHDSGSFRNDEVIERSENGYLGSKASDTELQELPPLPDKLTRHTIDINIILNAVKAIYKRLDYLKAREG